MRAPAWRCRDHVFARNRMPLVMGILNVTPDSFSDGGRFAAPDAAVERGLALLEAGADVLDIGGESSRPGAAPVSSAEELRRTVPVIAAILQQRACCISIDTTKADVARAALDAGAAIINDISALTLDPRMPALAARSGAGVVAMHMRGTPRDMQQAPEYRDVLGEVSGYLAARRDALVAAGVEPAAIALDPGIGFGKRLEHNLALLRGLRKMTELGCPLVIGVSRKSFLGTLTGRDVDARMAATVAAQAFALWSGADVLRAHDVGEAVDTCRVLAAIRTEGACGGGVA